MAVADGLEFSNGTHTLNGTTGSGAGTIKISNGNVDLTGNTTLPGLNLSGGAVGGTGNLTINGNLTQSGGHLGNFGDAAVTGTFIWSGGTVGNFSATASDGNHWSERPLLMAALSHCGEKPCN
ncbi:MAG: hypothetical protein IPM98_14170 [Lewinellaceae bacterium]|nr:hypothetical protein [Lewinellaceae bacterium]